MSGNMITLFYSELLNETEKAWLLRIDDEEVWIPKSQCELYEEKREFEIPEWLAIDKELI